MNVPITISDDAGHLANIEAGIFNRENAEVWNCHLARHRASAQIEPIESGCFRLQRGSRGYQEEEGAGEAHAAAAGASPQT